MVISASRANHLVYTSPTMQRSKAATGRPILVYLMDS